MMQQLAPNQASAEVPINDNFKTLSHQAVYGNNPATSSGLTWGYYGGRWGGSSVSDGTLTLTNEATNYVVVEKSTGVISVSTSNTNWNDTTDYTRVYQITTSGGVVTAVQDHRAGPNGVHGGAGGVGGSLASLSDVDVSSGGPDDGDVLTYVGSADAWVPRPATGGGGGSLPTPWAHLLAACLEPKAIEPVQLNTFTYTVGASETKLLVASWQTRLGSSGRMEVRDPGPGFVPLRDVSLQGSGAGSAAVIVDPDLVSYADPWATYYDRLYELTQLRTRHLQFTAQGQKKLLLPGPYGSVITSYTVFDLPWLCARPVGGSTSGFNLGNEESDTDGQRLGNRLMLCVDKHCCTAVHSDDTSDGSPSGSVTWVNLPSDWSAISDPNTYQWRDTFEGSSLDTGVWSRTVSTAGNIEIDTTYNWLRCKGNNAWGNNAVFKTTGIARSGSPTLIVDVAVEYGTDWQGFGAVGWHDGSGNSFSDLVHGLNIGSKGGGTTMPLSVVEAGTSKSTGLTLTEGAIYRFRITALSGGGATYEVQGGPEFDSIGGSTWDTITPSGGSSGSTATLHPGLAMFGSDLWTYFGDFRVI